MKAMVFAAGRGTRLAPLTDALPKALIEVGGRTLLEIVLARLLRAGVNAAVVNVHHLPERIAAWLAAARLTLPVALSRENELLDTGGGLRHAAPLLAGPEPFFVHNVDVLSAIDLGALMGQQRASDALATLAVQPRTRGRGLLFDGEGRLVGWEEAPGGRRMWAARPVPGAERLAFCGIHAASPALLARLVETGAFPIVSAYLRLAGEGADIRAFRADGVFWADIGTPEKLAAARKLAAEDRLPD
ncbi:nucleotidyltransferase family protein [bacterium]|nr:nucleotidyltransferase family protein [bacterium]